MGVSPGDQMTNPFISASELNFMQFEKREFLIENLLARNLTLLAGPPKIGKSFLCLSFAKHIIKQGKKVYYCSFEDDYARLYSRLLELDLLCDDLQIHCGRETVLGSTSDEEFNRLQSIAYDDQVALVILDTMERILPSTKQKRDYHYNVKVLDTWAKLALQSNTCMLMSHHMRKSDGTPDYNPNNAILGSIGIPATFDTNLLMNRDKDGGIALRVEGKDVKENTFQLSKSGVEFSWELTSPADKLGDAQKQVLEFIEQNPDCIQSDIVSKLGKSKSQVSQIISKLCSEGFLCKEDGRLFINTPY
jgi:RecA-family ATPase